MQKNYTRLQFSVWSTLRILVIARYIPKEFYQSGTGILSKHCISIHKANRN